METGLLTVTREKVSNHCKGTAAPQGTVCRASMSLLHGYASSDMRSRVHQAQ